MIADLCSSVVVVVVVVVVGGGGVVVVVVDDVDVDVGCCLLMTYVLLLYYCFLRYSRLNVMVSTSFLYSSLYHISPHFTNVRVITLAWDLVYTSLFLLSSKLSYGCISIFLKCISCLIDGIIP